MVERRETKAVAIVMIVGYITTISGAIVAWDVGDNIMGIGAALFCVGVFWSTTIWGRGKR